MKPFHFEYRFRFDGERVRFYSLDWGYGDCAPYLITNTEHYLVMRVPGRKNWKALGTFGYSPARWILLSYRPDGATSAGFISVERIADEEPGRKWQTCRNKMIKRMHALEKKYAWQYHPTREVVTRWTSDPNLKSKARTR